MQLAIDIGNTRLKWCLFNQRTVVQSGIIEGIEIHLLTDLLNTFPQAKTVVASVVALKQEMVDVLERNNAFMISHHTPIPIINNYQTPETLGMDRLCSAIGGASLFPAQPVLVVDAGTCLKFEFVDNNNTYQGGTIAPGLQMRFKALNSYTAKLPLIAAKPSNLIVGKSTEEAIRIGVQQGMKLEIEAMIRQMQALHPELRTVGTGGDFGFFANALKTHIFADPLLVLRGINEIYLHNN